MTPTTNSPFSKSWLPIRSPSSRVLRTHHIIVLSIIATLLILAVMREQLLYLLGAMTGYSSALPASGTLKSAPFLIPPGIHLAKSQPIFRISIFEDLHFGEDEFSTWAPAQDRATLSVMSSILASETPNLVVLNGDLITGENTYAENSTSYLDMLLQPIASHNLQFATVYGNHDNNVNISTSALLHREKARYPNLSLTATAVAGTEQDVGVSNYFLPVFFSGSTSWQPDLILWFFDSKGGRTYQPGSGASSVHIAGRVDDKVINWFKTTSQALKTYYQTSIPSLAFVHIPVSIMKQYQQENAPLDPERHPGMNEDYPVDPQHDDKNFVNALVEDDGVKAVFSAHDHGDDWCMPYKKWTNKQKMFFCLGRHTGYGGYSNWMRGSRVVEVDVKGLGKGEVKTWVRLEDGSVSGSVLLNATYGVDIYKQVERRCSKAEVGEVPCDGV